MSTYLSDGQQCTDWLSQRDKGQSVGVLDVRNKLPFVQANFVLVHRNELFADEGKNHLVASSFHKDVTGNRCCLALENYARLCQVINVTLHRYSATQYAVRQCIINLKSNRF